MARVRMEIAGMTCQHCVVRVERALIGAGARAVAIDLAAGRAEAEFAGDPEAVAGALGGAGYRAGALTRLGPDAPDVGTDGGGDTLCRCCAA